MNIHEIESASRSAWPALEEVELEGGVLRYASGVSRRSNALIPSVSGQFCPRTLIHETEQYYGGKGQAAVVKVLTKEKTNGAFEILDSLLEKGSYEKQAPTSVLGLQLKSKFSITSLANEFWLNQCSKSRWVEAWHSVRQFDPTNQDSHCRVLQRIFGRVHCLVLRDKTGRPCATGLAVMNKNSVGIFGIATAASHTGQGLASHILSELLNWSHNGGAGFVFLQVEDSNLPARGLYEKFGFSQLYSYWYRVKELAGNGAGDN